MPGEVRFVPTIADHVAGQRLWLAKYWRGRSFVATVAILAALGLVAAVVTGFEDGKLYPRRIAALWPLLCAPLALIVVQLLAWRLVPRTVRRMAGQQPTLLADTTWRWDNAGATILSDAGSCIIRWPELHGWLKGEASIVLTPQERMLLILPRRFLSSGEDADLTATLAAFAGGRTRD